MFKIHVYSKDRQFDQQFAIDDDAVLIGRAADCAVRLPEGRKDISRKHVRLLRGLVLDDLGSVNGTRIDGQKVAEALLLTQRVFQIGDPKSDNMMTVEVELADDSLGAADPGESRTMLNDVLESSPRDGVLRGQPRGEAERLRSRCADLESQLARLASERAGSRVPAPVPEGEATQRRLRELEARCAEAESALARARGGKSEAPGKAFASAMVERLERRCAELESELKALKSDRPGSGRGRAPESGEQAGASDLRAEIESLKRQNEMLRRSRAQGSGAGASDDGRAAELQWEVERLTKENLVLKQFPKSSRAADAVPRGASAPAGGLGFVRTLFETDPKKLPAANEQSVEEFLVTSQYVCLRRYEKLITLVARDLEGNIDMNTVLPRTGGQSFVKIAKRLLESPADSALRQEAREYLDSLGRWLGTSTQAYRQAATQLVDTLRQDLSESGLTRGRPLSSLLVGPLAQSELWQRAQTVLREWSTKSIEARLEDLARVQSNSLMKTGVPSGEQPSK